MSVFKTRAPLSNRLWWNPYKNADIRFLAHDGEIIRYKSVDVHVRSDHRAIMIRKTDGKIVSFQAAEPFIQIEVEYNNE